MQLKQRITGNGKSIESGTVMDENEIIEHIEEEYNKGYNGATREAQEQKYGNMITMMMTQTEKMIITMMTMMMMMTMTIVLLDLTMIQVDIWRQFTIQKDLVKDKHKIGRKNTWKNSNKLIGKEKNILTMSGMMPLTRGVLERICIDILP